ncbi:MAG: polysaccharide deacetylase family protein [Phaeodactylibacter sp.]|nr:polysaccharide deacetylase family protein [Phaeodactylibacter sp.]
MNKPLASLSLDLDNLWTYLKIHGDAGWENYPSYLDTFVPAVLDLLDQLKLRITFFIVGQDAALDKNKEYIQEIARRGHEVGNHSFRHESWLHTYSREALEAEVERAEAQIERVTGQRPAGFRGPGFSWSPALLDVLAERGYVYDASTLPTYIGPLARMYYFRTARLSREEREARKELFGSFRDGLRPVKPYFWKLESGKTLLEMPVTTIPVIKTPFHLSYLLYLNGFSPALMDLYLSLAIRMCQATGTQPSFLLHPLDLISGERAPRLKFFPGMHISSERKAEVFTGVMEKLGRHFKLAGMARHAAHFLQEGLSGRPAQSVLAEMR